MNEQNFGGDIGALVKAVNAVMRDVQWVQGTGTNPDQNYTYVSDADLALALQPSMAAHGLALMPVQSHPSTSEAGKTKAGATWWRCDLVQSYLLLHEGGGYVRLEVASAGMDTQDKGAMKAMTSTFKYVLRQTFVIPTGDDAEKPLAGAVKMEQSQKIHDEIAALLVTEKPDLKKAREMMREHSDALTDEHKKELARLRNAAEGRK